VGRGAQRAFAYFFRHRRRPPTLEGRQRLETIAENTQLGAGFSIAMRDLEIRGAGDLLGSRQHGHIAAVGFHLYTRLLADAVRRLRQSSTSQQKSELPPTPFTEFDTPLALPVNVDLPLPISIPVEYITDRETRLRLYRRIADVRSQAEIDALQEEFSDRFGPLPEAMRNLFYQLKIRILAEKAGITSVSAEAGQIVLRYPPLPEGISQRSFPTINGEVRTGKNAIWLPINAQADWQTRLISLIEELLEKSSLLPEKTA
jgi:transcription-repair coupling factor (superfamily II helicase)